MFGCNVSKNTLMLILQKPHMKREKEKNVSQKGTSFFSFFLSIFYFSASFLFLLFAFTRPTTFFGKHLWIKKKKKKKCQHFSFQNFKLDINSSTNK